MKCPSVSGSSWLCWWQVFITWKVQVYLHILLPPLNIFDRNAVNWCLYRKLKNFIPFNPTVLNSRNMNDFSYSSEFWLFSFQTNFISLIFHSTSFYVVTVLFDVSDATLEHTHQDVMKCQKHACLRNRYLWSLLVLVLVAAIITALVIALSGTELNHAPPSKAQLCYIWKMHRLQLLQ
jgi:hypothetical protein